MKRREATFLAMTLGVFLAVSPPSAFSQAENTAAPDGVVESYRKSIDSAGSPKEKAHLEKELGDVYRSRGEIARAAEEYTKALSHDRGFSAEDRLMMARHMSWGGKIDEAVEELKAILSEDPGNIDARNHLARCLSWKGDLGGSLEESSRVLAASPGNKDALLTRANALRWSGNSNAAVRIYKEILEKGEDFDTRAGLSQAYLSSGYVKGAKEGAERLEPAYPYQEMERNRLKAEIENAARPNIGAGYSHYHDTDDNSLDRYGLSAGIWAGYWRLGLGHWYVDATDPTRHAGDEEWSLSAESKVAERLSVALSAGWNHIVSGGDGDFLVGSARAEAGVLDGKAGVGAARRVFAETAQLIENEIRYTDLSAYFEDPLPRRFTVRASYAFKDFSDDNRSHDVEGSLRHAFDLANPAVTVGYRIRFLDFQRETDGGYFDPDGFLSHTGFLALSAEKSWAYAYFEPYFGFQSFRHDGSGHDDWVWGGSGVLGARSAKGCSIEIHGEGGDYAVQSATGFEYYLVGVRANVRF